MTMFIQGGCSLRAPVTVLCLVVLVGCTSLRAGSAVQANGSSYSPSISADGRFVAFASEASNLVACDTNACSDVFVYDRQTGRTERVSLGMSGAQANEGSAQPAISADGRWVTFASLASNLVPADLNDAPDVFLYDRSTGKTRLLSRMPDNFHSGNGGSSWPSISSDGQRVAFLSLASDLVQGDTNGVADVFLYDADKGQVRRVNVGPSGEQTDRYAYPGGISANGRFVAFTCSATNLAGPGPSDDWDDVFVHDLDTGQTTLLTASARGEPGDGVSSGASISGDGRWVAFVSYARNLVEGSPERWLCLYLADRQTGTITRVARVVAEVHGSTLDGGFCAISADGRYIAFTSTAEDLVPGDTNGEQDLFVYDRQTAMIQRVSVSNQGVQSNGWSGQPSISADGRFAAFSSRADNLVPGDTNEEADIFVYDMENGRIERVSVASR